MNYHRFLLLFMLFLLLTVATVSLVHAACTVQYVYTPDGRQVVCQQCCDSNGQCNTVCY